MSDLRIDEATPADALTVMSVIHRAFAARPRLDPPSTATDETRESIAAALAEHGGLVVRRLGQPVGAMLFDQSQPGQLGLRRVSVDPFLQAHGVASAMVGVAEDVAEARGLDGIWLIAREELPDNVTFWKRRGYCQTGNDGPNLMLGKTLWLARELATADDTHAFGKALAGHLRAGDLVVLTGELGAGKTTLAQGIGEGLGVRGPVTSPTFVIARVHPSLGDGPALVHADAYRLGGIAELDDLDLDASLDAAVTVVEWGAGLAEGLSEHRLDIRLDRFLGDGSSDGAAALAAAGPGRSLPATAGAEDLGPLVPASADSRVVSVRPQGARWAGVRLRSTLLP